MASPLIGSAYVEIHALDKFLQRDIDNAMKKIKEPSLNLTADVNLKPVRDKIKALRAELKNAPLQIRVEAQYEKLIDDLDVVKEELGRDPISLNVDSNVTELETALERVRGKYSDIPAQITANADTTAAEARLAFASRNRTSTISAHISPATQNALQGLATTLIGAVPVDKIKASLQGVAANFEMLSVVGYGLTTAIGALGAEALTGAANLFTLADDIGAVIGITAMAPAALAAMGIGVTANILAWKDFGEAITGTGKKGAEAMAKLPIEAQKAAQSLKGVGGEIRKVTQKAFWVEMGDAIQKLHDSVLPQLKIGLEGAGTAMGKLTRAVLDGFWEMGANGTLEVMFENINKGFLSMERGVQPFVEALGTLGMVGSKYLPQFGNWLSDLGVQFNGFIQEAERTGQIDVWIKEATNSLQNLGSIAKSTVGIFKGLAEASAMSGGASLEEFAAGMRNIRDVVNGEPFKSRLVTILEGARSGAEALGEGFKNLSKLVGESSGAIGEFLETSGQITGQLLTNITKMFDGTNLGTGMLTALWGLQDAMVALEPGFKDLGDVMGDLGEISGSVFESMAPGINILMSTLAGITDGLKDGVIAAMPVFNEFFQGIQTFASGPLIAIAGGIGNLLEVFAQLPGPIQTVLTTLALLVAFRGKIEGLFTGIGSAFTRMRSGIDGDTAGLSTSMRNMYGHFQTAGTHIGSAANAMRLIPFAATTSGMGGIATAAGAAATSVGRAAGSGLRGALSGGAALLGGPWGIALGAGIGLISAFGQAQADSAERVKAFSSSLDQQTGHITNATKKLVAESALDGATNGWDDFFRGVLQGSESTEEALRDLGISTKTFTDKLSDPAGRDAYVKGMNDISNAMRDGRPITDEMAAAIGTTKEQLKGVNGNTMRHLADEAGNTAGELTKAEVATRAIAAATGTSSAQAATLARNYEVLASATSSANDKFSALKQNLDILNGGSISFAESQKGVAQSLDDTKAKLTSIATDMGGSVTALYSVKDGFDFASQAGRDLHTALSGSSDSILKIGTAALDQALKGGKSATDANSIAIQAMQPAIASLRQQLADAGLMQPQIDSIIRSFGLMPDQITTAISVEGTEEAQRKIFLTKLAADSFGNGQYEAVLAALPEDAKKAIGDATGMGEAFKNGNYEAILGALDATGPGKEAALAQILSVSNGNYEAALKALDLTNPQVKAAEAQALGFKNQDYTAALEAVNYVGGPVSDATALSNAFKNADYTAFLKALNITQGPVSDATGASVGFARSDFTALLKAADSTAGGRAAAAAAISQTTGANYTAIIKALADQGSINGVSGALNGLTATRYATIVAQWREVGRNPGLAAAQDGLGANGAFLRSVTNAASMFRGSLPLEKFANGGFSEQHFAQIAKGGPVRMWAERETGGEAYIPLALSKRLRSLKILEQVAKMFGYGLFKSFADGGIMKSLPGASQQTSTPVTTTSLTVPLSRSGTATTSDRPNVSLTINSTQGYTPGQLAQTAVSELSWQFLNR